MKRLVGGAVAVGVLACASSALAQEGRQEVLTSKHKAYESAQHFAIELRFAPFTPDVDSNPSLKGTPFATTLGNFPRLMFQGEFDWQVLRLPHFGTLGPGVGVGYTKMSGNAQFVQPHGPSGTLTSGESTSLEIYPFYAVAVLRIDVLRREMRDPLRPLRQARARLLDLARVEHGGHFELWRERRRGGQPRDGARRRPGLQPERLRRVRGEELRRGGRGEQHVRLRRVHARRSRRPRHPVATRCGSAAQSWTFGLAFEF